VNINFGRRIFWTEERIHDVVTRRRAGETLAAIGKLYGLSAERIRQVLHREDRRKLSLSIAIELGMR
jgi:DNA-directed RNA polymerase sigma subunit (sigma70/sigma32)